MSRFERIYFLAPSFKPVGGVVKIFDYLNHARALGYEAVVCCPDGYDAGAPLFRNPRYAHVSPGNGIRFVGLDKFTVGPTDLCFFSWPPHYEVVAPRISRWSSHEQAILIVQNVRHANPAFTDGYALRLLPRPMARIMTNEVVLQAVEPYLNRESLTEVITLGHDTDFFRKARTGPLTSPLKVGYTTWKSKVGDEVAALLGDNPGYEFRAVREAATWEELRRLYHWADVFLATPFAEEGFYMPGLEAMAAGDVLLTPDAGGNRAYCEFGENCLYVTLDDARSYARALEYLREVEPGEVERLRRAGYAAARRHTLEHEEERFGAFLERLASRAARESARGHGEGSR
jgi:hypothetical protein